MEGFDYGAKFGYGVRPGLEPGAGGLPASATDAELAKAADEGSRLLKEEDKEKEEERKKNWDSIAKSGSRATGDLVAKNDPSRRQVGGNRLVSSWRGGRP